MSQSEERDPPELMRGPSGYPPTNLAILLLSCDVLDHEVCALVGRFVTECSSAYLRPTRSMTFREQELMGEVFTRHTRRTFVAWERFRLGLEMAAPAAEVRRVLDESREALVFELKEAVTAFSRLPGSVL
jgi:hypothetical protein